MVVCLCKKPFIAISVRSSKSVYGSNVCSRKPLKLLALVMFVQVKLLVLATFVQVIPLMLSMLIPQNPLVLVTFVQVNLFLETMFTQVNLFVKVMFVKVNPLVLKSFDVNLFVLTSDIYHVNSSLLNQQLFFIFLLPF